MIVPNSCGSVLDRVFYCYCRFPFFPCFLERYLALLRRDKASSSRREKCPLQRLRQIIKVGCTDGFVHLAVDDGQSNYDTFEDTAAFFAAVRDLFTLFLPFFFLTCSRTKLCHSTCVKVVDSQQSTEIM